MECSSNIDIKIDDGLPAYGVVRGGEGSNFWGAPEPACVDDPDNTTKYLLQYEAPNCYFYYYYSFRE